MEIPTKMRAARLHEVGAPLVVEELETPRPNRSEVLVRVHACGIVPNLINVLTKEGPWHPKHALTHLPAIFGLDPAGEIVAIGEDVLGFKVGERVYVNPGRSCESCEECANGNSIACKYYTFNGYFGLSEYSATMFERYRYAGFGQYMTAPTSALARLEDGTSFEQAARLGYIGTAYSGLKKAKVGPTSTVLINGASGTLGLGGVISALALGARKILGTGRDKDLLRSVQAIAPDRIAVFSTKDGSITDWALARTGGEGVHVVLDCLGPGTHYDPFLEGLYSLCRGGTLVDIGAAQGPIPIIPGFLTSANRSLVGSVWFTTQEARELSAMAGSGILDMSIFEHQVYPLDEINTAIAAMPKRNGGFSNFVIHPQR